MRKFVKAALALVPLLLLTSAPAGATGNGAPSGPHYNLNLHGVATGQSFSVATGSNTHNIFAPLNGQCKIYLQMGAFNVINPNCVNSNAAFQLPNPCPAGTTAALCPNFAYSVWVRAVAGKGTSTITTCFTDATGTYCNAGTLIVSLSKVTPPKFVNVSKQLLSVCSNVTNTTVPIFSDPLAQYFWQYDNQGLRLAQLRFYPIPTPSGIGSTCTFTVQ